MKIIISCPKCDNSIMFNRIDMIKTIQMTGRLFRESCKKCESTWMIDYEKVRENLEIFIRIKHEEIQ